METFENYEDAKAEAERAGKPIWRHDAGYYAVANHHEITSHCEKVGTDGDEWTEID